MKTNTEERSFTRKTSPSFCHNFRGRDVEERGSPPERERAQKPGAKSQKESLIFSPDKCLFLIHVGLLAS